MWLLDVKTVKLEYFMDDREIAGKYAILSHTWDKEEVTFADIHTPKALNMKGYKKIMYTCQQAIKDKLQYAWVDTCCINKESSAELSEAINSMYRWYQNSAVCYVYLSDVKLPVTFNYRRKNWVQLLRNCRWFTRGWTLQEMIAPAILDFYDESWTRMGLLNGQLPQNLEKANLNLTLIRFDETRRQNRELEHSKALATITSVHYDLIRKLRSLESFPLAERLHWASQRQTTRVEDSAYSLLGLLGVNMPLLYGEGSKAFIRLQEELLRTSMDLSILLWKPHLPEQMNLLIAPDPKCFRLSFGTWRHEDTEDYDRESLLTNRGLRTPVLLMPCAGNSNYAYAQLGIGGSQKVPILLRKVPQLHHLRSAAALPVFEIVRAPIPPDRCEEIGGILGTPKVLSFVEVVILRRARSWIWSLDCDAGLEVTIHEPGPTDHPYAAEIIGLWGSLLATIKNKTCVQPELHVIRSFRDTNRSVTSNTYGGIRFERHSSQRDIWQCRSLFDQQRFIRLRSWSPDDVPIQTLRILTPKTQILRIWLSSIDATPEEIYRESLPTPEGISRLWKIEEG